MKNLFVILVALLLVVAMPVSVYAAGLDSQHGTVGVVVDFDKDGIPDNEEDPADISARVYFVNVTWESLEFMFSGTWDPEKAEYEGTWMTQNGEAWSADDVQNITVENRSNAAIIASATMNTTEKNGVTAFLSENAAGVTLSSAAEVGAINNGVGPNATFTVTVSGIPTVSGAFNVGKITVSFSAVN